MKEQVTYPQPPCLKMAATSSSKCAGFEDGAIYCKECELWLNGSAQWEDHKLGKKHRNNLAIAESPDASAPSQGQAEQEAPPPPGFIMIRLLALSGNTIGSVLCRSEATWQEVAAAIVNTLPRAQPVPPPNARILTAGDLLGGVQVLGRPAPDQ